MATPKGASDNIGTLSVDIKADVEQFNLDLTAVEGRLDKLSGRAFSVPFAISQDTITRLGEAVRLATEYANVVKGMSDAQLRAMGSAHAAAPAAAATQAAPKGQAQAQPVSLQVDGPVDVNISPESIRSAIEAAFAQPISGVKLNLDKPHLQKQLDTLVLRVGVMAGDIPPGAAGAPSAPTTPMPQGPPQRGPLPGAFNKEVSKTAVREVTGDFFAEVQSALGAAGGKLLDAVTDTADQIHAIRQRFGPLKEMAQFGEETPAGRPVVSGTIAELAKGNALLTNLVNDYVDATQKANSAYTQHKVANLYTTAAPPPAPAPPPTPAHPAAPAVASTARMDRLATALERRMGRRLAAGNEGLVDQTADLIERIFGPSGPGYDYAQEHLTRQAAQLGPMHGPTGPTHIPPAPITMDRIMRELHTRFGQTRPPDPRVATPEQGEALRAAAAANPIRYAPFEGAQFLSSLPASMRERVSRWRRGITPDLLAANAEIQQTLMGVPLAANQPTPEEWLTASEQRRREIRQMTPIATPISMRPLRRSSATDSPIEFQPIIGRENIQLGGRDQNLLGRFGFEGASPEQLQTLWEIQQAAKSGELRGWVERLKDGQRTREFARMAPGKGGKFALKPKTRGVIEGMDFEALTDTDVARMMMLAADIPEDVVDAALTKASPNTGGNTGRMLQELQAGRKKRFGMSANRNFIPLMGQGGHGLVNPSADALVNQWSTFLEHEGRLDTGAQSRELIDRENLSPFVKEGEPVSVINQIRDAKRAWQEQKKKTPELLPLLDELGEIFELWKSGGGPVERAGESTPPEGASQQVWDRFRKLNVGQQTSLSGMTEMVMELLEREGGIYSTLGLSDEKRNLKSMARSPGMRPIVDLIKGYQQAAREQRRVALEDLGSSRIDMQTQPTERNLVRVPETELDRQNQQLQREIDALQQTINIPISTAKGKRPSLEGEPGVPKSASVPDAQGREGSYYKLPGLPVYTTRSAQDVRRRTTEGRRLRALLSAEERAILREEGSILEELSPTGEATGRFRRPSEIAGDEQRVAALREQIKRNQRLSAIATEFGNAPEFVSQMAGTEEVMAAAQAGLAEPYRRRTGLLRGVRKEDEATFLSNLREQLRFRLPGSLGQARIKGDFYEGMSGEEMAWRMAQTGPTRPGGLEPLPEDLNRSEAEQRRQRVRDAEDIRSRVADEIAAEHGLPPSEPPGPSAPPAGSPEGPMGDGVNVWIKGSVTIPVRIEGGGGGGGNPNELPASHQARLRNAGLNARLDMAAVKPGGSAFRTARMMQEQGWDRRNARTTLAQWYGAGQADEALSNLEKSGVTFGGEGGGGGGGTATGGPEDEFAGMPSSVRLPKRLDLKRFTREQLDALRGVPMPGPTRSGTGRLISHRVGDLQFMPPAWLVDENGEPLMRAPQGTARSAQQQLREIAEGERLRRQTEDEDTRGGAAAATFRRAEGRLRQLGINITPTPGRASARAGEIGGTADEQAARISALLRRQQGQLGQRAPGPMVTSTIMNVLAGMPLFRRSRELELSTEPLGEGLGSMAEAFGFTPERIADLASQGQVPTFTMPGDPFERINLVNREKAENLSLSNQLRQERAVLAEQERKRQEARGQVEALPPGARREEAEAALKDLEDAQNAQASQVEKTTKKYEMHSRALDFLGAKALRASDVLGNLAQGFVGGIGGSLVTMGIGKAVTGLMAVAEVAKIAFEPAYEAAIGYQNVTNRVISSLSDQVHANDGLVESTVALAAAQKGLGVGTYAALGPQLEQAVAIEAGNKAYGEYIDLIRAAERAGGDIPRGLFQSTNGLNILGVQTPLFGTPSTLENWMNQFNGVPRTQGTGPFAPGVTTNDPLGAFVQNMGTGFRVLSDISRGVLTGDLEGVANSWVDMAEAQQELKRTRIDQINEQLNKMGHGIRAVGGASEETMDAIDSVLKEADVAQSIRDQFRSLGVGFVDAQGRPITSRAGIMQGFQDFSQGLDRTDWRQQLGFLTSPTGALTLQLEQQRQVAQLGRGTGFMQFYMQRLAQPPMPFGAGIPTQGPYGEAFRAQAPMANFWSSFSKLFTAQGEQIFNERIANLTPEEQGSARYYQGIAQLSGQDMLAQQVRAREIQMGQLQRQFAQDMKVATRNLGDLIGASGGRPVNVAGQTVGATDIGLLQGANRQQSRDLQLLQFSMQRRALDFQVALAGFAAPGETGEEIAARQRIAELQARDQRTLLEGSEDIAGREFKIQTEQLQRGVDDATFQVNNLAIGMKESAALAGIQEAMNQAASANSFAAQMMQSFAEQGTEHEATLISVAGQMRALGATTDDLGKDFQDLRAWLHQLMGSEGDTPFGFGPYLGPPTPPAIININNPSAGVDTGAMTRAVLNELNRQAALRGG